MRAGFAVAGILGLAGIGAEAFVVLPCGHALQLFGSTDGDVLVGLQLQLLGGVDPGPKHSQFIGTGQAQIALRCEVADQHVLALLLAFGFLRDQT
ncbi:hypothetical protein D3C77_362520 [compost metagenome]